MYWRRSVTALLVAKPSAAALPKVAKPSGHCITHFKYSNITYLLSLLSRSFRISWGISRGCPVEPPTQYFFEQIAHISVNTTGDISLMTMQNGHQNVGYRKCTFLYLFNQRQSIHTTSISLLYFTCFYILLTTRTGKNPYKMYTLLHFSFTYFTP